MSQANLDVHRVIKACQDLYLDCRDEFEAKGEEWPDDGKHWYNRVQWIEALAEAAVQCGQPTIAVSLEDYKFIHRRWKIRR